MQLVATAAGLSAVGSFGGLLLASSLLLFRDRVRVRLVAWLVSYAVGTLLGAALLKLVPEALDSLPPTAALGTLLAGILTFFLLERAVVWRHCHEEDECAVHTSAASLVIIGDAVHTFVDGAIIGAAVLTSVPLGISTALAAAAHEVPQEIGDFAVLLHAGYSRKVAMTLNLLSGVAGVIGAIAVVLLMESMPRTLPYVIAFAAGCFLYVAMADLIPDLHRGSRDQNPFLQTGLILGGIATIALL